MTPAEQKQTIVWLHLSDLHLCEPKTGWDAHRVLEPLLKDLNHMEKSHGLSPQLLFFTGDLAFGNIGSKPGESLTDQYLQAETFLTEVRQAFNTPIPKENLFIVPGNHDVDRAEVTDSLTDWLDDPKNAGKITALIKDGNKQWRQYMERLHCYRRFLQDNAYDHLLEDPERLIYAQVRDINGVKIGVGGFNSAWNCGRDQEKGKIWLGGDWQNGKIVQRLKQQNADMHLALIHHPPGWLVEQEANLVEKQMQRDFHFLLHGHEHQDWVSHINNRHVRVAAAACYEKSDHENGYNFVRLNLATGEVEVWLRRFDSDGGGWIPRIVANRTNNDGLWKLSNTVILKGTEKSDTSKYREKKSDKAFTQKVREKIKQILESAKPAARAFRENLLKDQPGLTCDAVLLPDTESVDVEAAILKWLEVMRATLQQAHVKTEELKKIANEVFGWLILLCVDGGFMENGGHSIDLNTLSEIMVPIKTPTGVEVYIAKLQQRPAQFRRKGSDSAFGYKTLDPVDVELGLLSTDKLLELKKMIYVEFFKTQPDLRTDFWLERLRETLKLRFKLKEMYYLNLPEERFSEHIETIRQLKSDLPHLQIIISGVSKDNGDSILIMDESRLEAFILSFYNIFDSFENIEFKYETTTNETKIDSETQRPVRLFYSYSHQDEVYRVELEKHLANLKRQGVIEDWHDRKIIAGQAWEGKIDENLNKADVILLLISPDFMASDYCHQIEMTRALERHDNGEAIVVPIMLRATDIQGSPFARLQGLPINLKPIKQWNDQDEAYVDVVRGLRNLIKNIPAKTVFDVDRKSEKQHAFETLPVLNTNYNTDVEQQAIPSEGDNSKDHQAWRQKLIQRLAAQLKKPEVSAVVDNFAKKVREDYSGKLEELENIAEHLVIGSKETERQDQIEHFLTSFEDKVKNSSIQEEIDTLFAYLLQTLVRRCQNADDNGLSRLSVEELQTAQLIGSARIVAAHLPNYDDMNLDFKNGQRDKKFKYLGNYFPPNGKFKEVDEVCLDLANELMNMLNDTTDVKYDQPLMKLKGRLNAFKNDLTRAPLQGLFIKQDGGYNPLSIDDVAKKFCDDMENLLWVYIYGGSAVDEWLYTDNEYDIEGYISRFNDHKTAIIKTKLQDSPSTNTGSGTNAAKPDSAARTINSNEVTNMNPPGFNINNLSNATVNIINHGSQTDNQIGSGNIKLNGGNGQALLASLEELKISAAQAHDVDKQQYANIDKAVATITAEIKNPEGASRNGLISAKNLLNGLDTVGGIAEKVVKVFQLLSPYIG